LPRWVTEPPDLAPEALEVWKSLAPGRFRAGYLRENTAHELMAYCRFVVIARKAASSIEADGVTIKALSGAVRANPAFAVLIEAQREAQKLFDQFFDSR
jgi:phage terminase small subunit